MILVAKASFNRKYASLCLAGLIGLLSGCIDSAKEKVLRIDGRTMGTTYSVKFVVEGSSDLEKVKIEVKNRVEQDLVEVNRQMSTYLPDSEISKLNRSKAGAPIQISNWFGQTLELSLDLARKTEGRFDPTIGPLVNLWGFGPSKKTKTPPSSDKIQFVRSYVGFNKVRLSKKNSDKSSDKWVVSKLHDKVFLDLSASAKGFGVDVVSRALRNMGYTNHLVEIGGELRSHGKKGSEPWRVAIEKPDATKRAVQKVLVLENMSLATSGSYRNFFSSGGKNYSHTIDSKTGKPVQNKLISVSVLDKDCVRADALATALMTMGVEQALTFAKSHLLAVYMIYGKNVDGKLQTQVEMTETFSKLVSN